MNTSKVGVGLGPREAAGLLTAAYGISRAHAVRDVQVAAGHGLTVTNAGDMRSTVTVRHRPGTDLFDVAPGTPPQYFAPKKLRAEREGKISGKTRPRRSARTATGGIVKVYKGQNDPHNQAHQSRRDTMARGTQVADPAEVDYTQSTEIEDLSEYAEKPLTALQQDFAEWLTAATGVQVDERSTYLAITLYHRFQASGFNKARKAERREARAAAAAAASNGAAQAAPATPKATRGRKATAPATAPATTKPARRGRKPAAAKAEAPF